MKRNAFWLVLLVLLLVPFMMGASCTTSGDDDDDDDNSGWDDDDDADDDDDGDDDNDSDDDDDGDDDDGDDDDGDDDDDDDDDDGGSVSDARDEDEGTPVTVTAVVISPTDFSGDTFFIQDADKGSAGIAVYMWNEVAEGYDGEPGDIVTVTGYIDDYYGLMEIVCENDGGSVEVTGSGDEPDPTTLDIADIGEDYESMLIEVTDVEVVEEINEYGEFVVEDGNGDRLIIDDLFFEKDHFSGVSNGDTYDSIVGVLNYGYEEWKLEPRSDSDLD